VFIFCIHKYDLDVGILRPFFGYIHDFSPLQILTADKAALQLKTRWPHFIVLDSHQRDRNTHLRVNSTLSAMQRCGDICLMLLRICHFFRNDTIETDFKIRFLHTGGPPFSITNS